MKKLLFLSPVLALLFGSVLVQVGAQISTKYQPELTPEGLHKSLIQLLKDLDDSAAIPFGGECDDSTTRYKDYLLLVEALQDDGPVQFDLLDPKKPEQNASLGRLYDVLKEQKSGFFCPITKGLTCDKSTRTCLCRTDFRNNGTYDQSKLKVFEFERRSCLLEQDSVCRGYWETPCNGDDDKGGTGAATRCYITFSDEAKKSVHWIDHERFEEIGRLCDHSNIYKYSLFDEKAKTQFKDDGEFSEYMIKLVNGVDCKCKGDIDKRINVLTSIRRSFLNNSKLNFGDACDVTMNKTFSNLSTLITDLSFAKRIQERFATNADEDARYEGVRQAVLSATENQQKLCDTNADGKGESLVCSNGKCNCSLGSSRKLGQDGKERCYLDIGAPCGEVTQNPCTEGESCMFEEFDTLCSKENIKFLTEESIEPKTEKCSCRKGNPKKRFTKAELNDLETRRKKLLTDEVLEAVLGSGVVAVKEKGQKCEFANDRLWFQFKDFETAGKLDVFRDMKEFRELKEQLEEAKKENKTFSVCRLEKGMRCNFFMGKCGCPMDGFLLNNIESVYDKKSGRCLLPKRSLCHPTLTDWLRCQDGEQCLYKELQVPCNRENKHTIVKNGMKLKDARCYCSKKKAKKLDAKLIREYMNGKKKTPKTKATENKKDEL